MAALSSEEIMRALEGCPNEVFYITPKPILHNGVYMQVNRAGIVTATPPDHHITRTSGYRYCVIHCAFRGQGYVTVRNRTHAIRKGQCWLLAPQEPHEYWADPDDPWGLGWVEFGGGSSSQLAHYILDHAPPVFDGSVFLRELELCTSILARQELFEPTISATLYDMLMCLCASVEKHSRERGNSREILAYIDGRLGTRLTLESVAAHFGYNPNYFSTMFSRTTGVTFSKYVQLQRINQSRILLITTQWPLESISEELGYYDTSHFIHAFKAEEGVTPAAYRKAYQLPIREA
ncbi:MAG: AraC family transcriptional regulator [Clostridia bacterium]|nr:AraC family transcriptional regulator [Clostridia bacterium]